MSASPDFSADSESTVSEANLVAAHRLCDATVDLAHGCGAPHRLLSIDRLAVRAV
jgi:hypothetical protein